MVPFAVLFAEDAVKEAIQPYIDKLPGMPLPEMPILGIPAYVMAGFGALGLLICLWRLLTLRIFRFIFGLIGALLMAYFPVAYAFHYWWFTYQVPSMEGRELESWETYIKENLTTTVDYAIMAVGFVLGFLFLYLSRVRSQKNYGVDDGGQAQHQQGRAGGDKNPFNFG